MSPAPDEMVVILKVSLGLEEFPPPFLMTVWGLTDRPEAIYLRIRVHVRVSTRKEQGKVSKVSGHGRMKL